MADRIAIIGNEPYAEWIERDGTAQRLFKAYCDKWPDGDTQCVVIGDEFYVRFSNGDGMRRIHRITGRFRLGNRRGIPYGNRQYRWHDAIGQCHRRNAYRK